MSYQATGFWFSKGDLAQTMRWEIPRNIFIA